MSFGRCKNGELSNYYNEMGSPDSENSEINFGGLGHYQSNLCLAKKKYN